MTSRSIENSSKGFREQKRNVDITINVGDDGVGGDQLRNDEPHLATGLVKKRRTGVFSVTMQLHKLGYPKKKRTCKHIRENYLCTSIAIFQLLIICSHMMSLIWQDLAFGNF